MSYQLRHVSALWYTIIGQKEVTELSPQNSVRANFERLSLVLKPVHSEPIFGPSLKFGCVEKKPLRRVWGWNSNDG